MIWYTRLSVAPRLDKQYFSPCNFTRSRLQDNQMRKDTRTGKYKGFHEVRQNAKDPLPKSLNIKRSFVSKRATKALPQIWFYTRKPISINKKTATFSHVSEPHEQHLLLLLLKHRAPKRNLCRMPVCDNVPQLRRMSSTVCYCRDIFLTTSAKPE